MLYGKPAEARGCRNNTALLSRTYSYISIPTDGVKFSNSDFTSLETWCSSENDNLTPTIVPTYMYAYTQGDNNEWTILEGWENCGDYSAGIYMCIRTCGYAASAQAHVHIHKFITYHHQLLPRTEFHPRSSERLIHISAHAITQTKNM